jgi:P27 family predicted phage terminase small subunit
VSAVPGCPTWLKPEAKAEWRRVVPELHRLGLLARIDRAALTAYCCCWFTYVAAMRELRASSPTIETKQGPVRHPAWQVAREAQREMRAWCAEFGLTPSSRSRMVLPEGLGTDDPDLD